MRSFQQVIFSDLGKDPFLLPQLLEGRDTTEESGPVIRFVRVPGHARATVQVRIRGQGNGFRVVGRIFLQSIPRRGNGKIFRGSGMGGFSR